MLLVKFDWIEGTLVPIGSNSKLVSICAGNHIKHTVPPYYADWAHVPQHFKEQMINAIEVLKSNMMYF